MNSINEYLLFMNDINISIELKGELLNIPKQLDKDNSCDIKKGVYLRKKGDM